MERDLYSLIEELKNSWQTNFEAFIVKIDEQVIEASTYGEVCNSVGGFLKDLKKESNPAYIDSRDLVNEILLICTNWGRNTKLQAL